MERAPSAIISIVYASETLFYSIFFVVLFFGTDFIKISSAVHQAFPNFPGGMATLAAMFNRSQYQFPSSHV